MDAEAIASKVPPPDELGDGEPDADDGAYDDAHKTSMMESLGRAFGVTIKDPKAACEALEEYLDAAGYRRD